MVQIGEFVYLVDFIVLDIDTGHDTRLATVVLLGRPFLATVDAVIHCRSGMLEIKFRNLRSTMRVVEAVNKLTMSEDNG